MQHDKNDYIIVKNGDKRHQLAKIVKTSPLQAVVADRTLSKTETRQTFQLEDKDVVANLGPDARFGSAYGVSVEPYYFSTLVEELGYVLFYRKLKDETRVRLLKFMRKFGKKLKADGLFPSKEFEISVREPKGRWLGYYKYHKSKDVKDELCVRPPSFGITDELEYLFAHEVGHGLWFNNMNNRQRAEWVRAYHRNVTLAKTTSESLNQLRIGLLGVNTPSEHFKNLDDDDKLVMKEIYRIINHNYSIDKHDIEDLIQDGDNLTSIWPTKIELTNKTVVVSEYAMSNAKEFFAEAFAFTRQGKTIPKRERKLMKKTLRAIKAGNSSDD